ncbi:LysE family translocator [Stella sp.]|uniref:LysE family translocator n=1 Tax=Stella sp. TaxID=2912054 RepID=UPI0035B01AC2
MDPAVLAAAAVAGAIVVLTPGPAVLALVAIGAAQGRRAGAAFIFGHLVGDLLWSVLALAAMVGARTLAPRFFVALALVCAGYLFWLGLSALRARPDAAGRAMPAARRPLRRGLVFGLANPKSYPVTLSVYTALLAHEVEALTWTNAPLLLAACFAGFLAADLVLIWLVGAPPVRRLYRAHEIRIVRATGALFVFFAVTTAWQALAG